MKNLLIKENYNKEELEKLDIYYDNNLSELLEFDNNVIIKFIESCEEVLGYSLTKIELEYYLLNESLDAKFFFEEDKLDYYNKILELTTHFSFSNCDLDYVIGDYFYNQKNIEAAIKHYGKVFDNDFDLSKNNYFESLLNYLRLLNKNPSNYLKKFLNSSKKTDDYSSDIVNVYLLLIINLEKFSDEYLFYINEGIKISTKVVRKYQEGTKNRNYFSDTDDERNLCELVTLKFEYYVHIKDYVKAFELYNQLSYEIYRSDCTRYYHARERYYHQMLEYMSETYPKLKYFDDVGYCEFKVLDLNELKINQEVILEKEDGLQYKFKIVNISEYKDVTIVPILPIIGEGAKIYTEMETKDGVIYLKNKLSR